MKILKKLLVMILAICMLASSTDVYADYNGTGTNDTGNGASHGSGVSGGASWRKTGIVIYLLEKDKGSVLSNSVILYPGSANYTNPDSSYFKTRIGEMDIKEKHPIGTMPSPITWTGTAFQQNYSELREWLSDGTDENIDAPNPKRYLRLVDTFLRPEYDEAVAQGKKISLCIEGVAWHSLFKGIGENTGTPDEYISTAGGWAKVKKDNKISGRTFTYKMDNIALPQLMRLEYKQFGWKTSFGYTYVNGEVTDDQILANGYGINIVNLSAPIPSTKTPTPAPMKSDNGTYSVIKCYEDIIPPVEGAESAEPQYQHKASYINTKAPERLYIESEEEYTVTDWEVIKEKVENINPSDSYDAITSGKTPTNTGNGDSEVSLCEESPTVVIRLRQGAELNIPPKDIALSGDKEITESKITQSFSDVAANSLRFVGN